MIEINIKFLVMLCGVAVLGVVDIRKKNIPVAAIGALLGFGVTWNIITGEQIWWQMIFGVLPAAVLIPLKLFVKLNIGAGDIGLLMMLGASFGAEGAVSIMLLASLICLVSLAVLWLIKKLKKGVLIPFVPFIGAGLCVTGLAG